MKRDIHTGELINSLTGQREPIRGFDMKKHMQGMPRRPGAFDYLDIPSKMGEERVPYQSNLRGLIEK